MKLIKYFCSRIFVCLAVLLFLLQSVCFAAKNIANEKTQSDNYLVGMSVRKTFTGDYSIKLRFKNNTNHKYKLKELGNNSYTLFLPQVRSVISERDIYYENEHDDLKIVFSEKNDMVNPDFVSTQINFKTKDTAILKIQALAESSKVYDSEKISDNQSANKQISKGIWYLLIALVFTFITFALIRKRQVKKPHLKKSAKNVNKDKSLKTEHNENKVQVSESVQNDESLQNDEPLQNEEPLKNEEPLQNEEQTQVDLALMPGVPELPFLDKNDKPKIVLKEKKFDVFDPENFSDDDVSQVVFPDKSSISERFKNRNTDKDIDNLVFIERDSFLEKLSSINDITMPASSSENPSESKDDTNIQVQYDELMAAFKNVLRIAHKVFDDSLSPEVVDAFAISDTVGFCLVEYGDKTSLVGNIRDKVFLIRTFSPEELGNDTLFMEFCTETKNSQTYSVMLNNFKALIRVTSTNISLIGDYTG